MEGSGNVAFDLKKLHLFLKCYTSIITEFYNRLLDGSFYHLFSLLVKLLADIRFSAYIIFSKICNSKNWQVILFMLCVYFCMRLYIHYPRGRCMVTLVASFRRSRQPCPFMLSHVLSYPLLVCGQCWQDLNISFLDRFAIYATRQIEDVITMEK